MPIYEYRCDQGHTFEVLQRMSDDPVQRCATCEAPVERLFHPVAVHFKGSGFYNTDYGKARRGRSSDGEGDGATDSGSDAKKSDEGKGASESKASSGEGKGSGESKKGSADSSSKATSGAGSSRS